MAHGQFARCRLFAGLAEQIVEIVGNGHRAFRPGQPDPAGVTFLRQMVENTKTVT